MCSAIKLQFVGTMKITNANTVQFVELERTGPHNGGQYVSVSEKNEKECNRGRAEHEEFEKRRDGKGTYGNDISQIVDVGLSHLRPHIHAVSVLRAASCWTAP